MPKRPAGVPIVLPVHPGAGATMHRQGYEGLRTAILTGRLRPGSRLPSPRSLATDLAVSRNTGVAAFSRPVGEGYAEARGGGGAVGARGLPEAFARGVAA